MKILILGGRGNLGSQLAAYLSEVHQVFSWDQEDLNVLDFDKLRINVSDLHPEIIINTVAYNAVDLCEEASGYEAAGRLNSQYPAVLADLALTQQAILVHYSSDYVFNGTLNKPSFLETETPNPVNRYGESKFRGELEILNRASLGLKYYLIRTSKLFGPRGSSPAAKPSFFDIMEKLAQANKEIRAVNEELSCFTYTPDLAAATGRLLNSGRPFGKYHLINEGPCTWYEAAREFFRLRGLEVNLRAIRGEDLARPARRPKFSVLTNTKFKKLRDYRDALKDYVNNQI